MAVGQRPLAEPASRRHREFANYLSIASSILGGAILQVFLAPPAVVTADAEAIPDAFGWCEALHSCLGWQRAWQLGCVVAFCFVILSIIASATAAIARKSTLSLAAAIVFFLASFMATAVAVLAIVFLSFSRATCIASSALLFSLLISSTLLSWDGIIMGLDDVFLAPCLWRAAARGNLTAVQRYLWLGANPSWGSSVQESKKPREGSKSYFLSSGGTVHGVTALHIAAFNGCQQVVKELADSDVKMSATDGHGSTALHVAAANMDAVMVTSLMEQDPQLDCWALNKAGWTPLLAAMEACVKTKLPGVMSHPPDEMHDPEDKWERYLAEVKRDASPTQHANERKQLVQLLLLCPAGSAIDAICPKHGLTALQLAIKRQWTETALLLIKAGASADVPGTAQTTLGLACITPPGPGIACGIVAKRLLKSGANVNWQGKDGATALHTCIDHLHAAALAGAGQDECSHLIGSAQVLLSSGADTGVCDSAGVTPLMKTARMPGQLGAGLTNVLLSFSPKLDTEDHLGKTALNYAIRAGNIKAVELLLIAGADPNPMPSAAMAMTMHDRSPLSQAARKGAEEITALLLMHEADVNFFPPVGSKEKQLREVGDRLGVVHPDLFGRKCVKMPPLMHAVFYDRPRVVELLLINGADIQETGNSAYPGPLFCAAERSRDGEAVRLLLDAGSKRYQTDSQGRTPTDYAFDKQNDAALAAFAGLDLSPWKVQRLQDGLEEEAMEGGEEEEEEEESDRVHASQLASDSAESTTPANGRPRHAAINIPIKPAVPRLSVLGKLAQAVVRMLTPFGRSGSGSTQPPMPRTPSATSSGSSGGFVQSNE